MLTVPTNPEPEKGFTPVAPRKKNPLREFVADLLRAQDAARFCACSRSSWDRAAAAALTPAAIRIAGVQGWSRVELREWILQGCPPRAVWSKLWPQVRDSLRRK